MHQINVGIYQGAKFVFTSFVQSNRSWLLSNKNESIRAHFFEILENGTLASKWNINPSIVSLTGILSKFYIFI
jgi:hypothetical protein